MLKVLFFVPDQSGSAFYRLIQPAAHLDSQGLAQVAIAGPREERDQVYDAIAVSDVLIFGKVSTESKAQLFEGIRKYGKKVVMDVDDDMFNLSPYSPFYGQIGTEEAWHIDEMGQRIPLWRDGLDGFDIKKNQDHAERFKRCLRSVDLITVSSPYLAELYRDFAPTALVPYAVDAKWWKPVKLKYPGQSIRLGWRGSQSHYEDLMWIKPVITKLLEAHRQLKIVMLGWCPQAWANGFEGRIEVHPWVPNEFYPNYMMSLGCDLSFTPWTTIPFNKGKCETPWIEWSALGVPGVYPAVSPLTEAISHNETGLLALSLEGWFESLNKLIKDPGLRDRVGRTARTKVETDWDVRKTILKYQKLLEGLCSTKSLELKGDQVGLLHTA